MVGGKVLVLGGIRSGKSAYAESLLGKADRVRYVATAAAGQDDEDFAKRIEAHRFRRPASWETVETAGEPGRLIDAITAGDAPLLVDDLGNWAAALLGRKDAGELIAQLADVVERSDAEIVFVSPEVGMSVVPPTEAGVEFADLMGRLNFAMAGVCDTVTLVVAGQPTLLKRGRRIPRKVAPAVAEDTREEVFAEAAGSESAGSEPAGSEAAAFEPGMDLPIHDDEARTAARRHLSELDIQRAGLGVLAGTVVFAAGTQSKSVPRAWERPHMLLLHGSHAGNISSGESISVAARLAEEAERGEGAIGLLATWNGVSLRVVETESAEDIAYVRAAAPHVIEAMLSEGKRLADEAVDSGADLIILGSCGAGAEGAAATLVARITGAEIATLLARIVGPDGTIDDASWMLRCAAARDALHRVRDFDLLAKTLLSELGGADFALAAGVVLGATARRTAVLMDGPMATAAALLARDLGSQSRLWCTLPDHSGHPTTKTAADVLGLTPILDLKVDLGEGAVALLSLPLLRAGLHLSTALETGEPG